jgi:hypothetical protein
MKDKTPLKKQEPVLHKLDEGQKAIEKARTCPSFIGRMKDKTPLKKQEPVLHKLDEGQNVIEKARTCPS